VAILTGIAPRPSLGAAAIVSIGLSGVGLGGCTAARHEERWGAGVTASSSWRQLGDAIRGAATEAPIWLPMAGAVLLQVGDADRRASAWLRRHAPLGGSSERAGRISDYSRDLAGIGYWITAAVSRSGVDARSWATDKGKGIAVGLTAGIATDLTTAILKDVTNRSRPDGTDRRSMPSGHASLAAVHARLAARNLRYVPVDRRIRTVAEALLYATTLACAWSRVEAGKHYPSDTLVGTGIGFFLADLFDRVFVDGGHVEPPALFLGPGAIGVRLRIGL
jgi:membrane-associated phospholipid phosphatase